MSQNSAFPRLIAAFLSLTKFIRAAGSGTGTALSDGGAVRFPGFVAARAALAPKRSASDTAQSTLPTTPRGEPCKGSLSKDLVWFAFIVGPWFEWVCVRSRVAPAPGLPWCGASRAPGTTGASGTSGARPEASSANRHGVVDRLGTETRADRHGGRCGNSVGSEDVVGQPEHVGDERLAPADDLDPDGRVGDRFHDGQPELAALDAHLVDAADRGTVRRGHGERIR